MHQKCIVNGLIQVSPLKLNQKIIVNELIFNNKLAKLDKPREMPYVNKLVMVDSEEQFSVATDMSALRNCLEVETKFRLQCSGFCLALYGNALCVFVNPLNLYQPAF